jgi:PAS domain S-box-containing protein
MFGSNLIHFNLVLDKEIDINGLLLHIIKMDFSAEARHLNFDDILNQTETRMFIKDIKGRYIACNKQFAQDAGYVKTQDIFGKTDEDMSWRENSNYYRECNADIMKTGTAVVNKIERQTFGGKKDHYLFISLYPIKDANGEIQALLGAYKDITALKEFEFAQLDLQKKYLTNQKYESLGILAGGLAHDFNNFLLSIIGNLELVLSETKQFSPDVVEILEDIKRNTIDLTALTKQLLAYSGKGKITLTKIDLNTTVSHIWKLLRASISKDIQININLEKNLPLIEADVQQIQQVVINLVANAAESINNSVGTITITTGVQHCDEEYIKRNRLGNKISPGLYSYIEVIDTGTGIKQEQQDKIFEPFYTTKDMGRGLGLPAVMGIIKGHKGSLLLYSEINKGSTFKCLFPAIDVPDSYEPSKLTNEHYNNQEESYILVVDDEEMVRNTLKRILEKFGYKVILAVDGVDAIEKFKENSNTISLVIMDLTMPRMDGSSAFSELKKIKKDVKVILSSGYNAQELSQRFVSKGVAGFLQKPYEIKDLLEKIKNLYNS